jgi:N-carbamoyl-L-amino-acid hydrolase
MVSGTGHDAQFIATYIPFAIIFVLCVNGKSYSEDELTAWEDYEKGVNVVLHTVLELLLVYTILFIGRARLFLISPLLIIFSPT